MFIPTILETKNNSNEVYDIYSKLLKNRIIFLSGEINDELSNLIISELLYLDSINHLDIEMYINSPGGSVTSGLAIIDTMNFIKSNVVTIATGLAASMSSIILANGTKNKRYALKNSEIMIHQPISATNGQITDIEIQTKRMIEKKKLITKMLAELTNNSYKKIEKDLERDKYFTSKEAIEYGLIDKII